MLAQNNEKQRISSILTSPFRHSNIFSFYLDYIKNIVLCQDSLKTVQTFCEISS